MLHFTVALFGIIIDDLIYDLRNFKFDHLSVCIGFEVYFLGAPKLVDN